jgi:ABC-type multidrug transport system fused ATPase/permease subunit
MRKKISFIQQEPILFNGTLRENLDPENEFDDEKIINIIEEVKLNEILLINKNEILNFMIISYVKIKK